MATYLDSKADLRRTFYSIMGIEPDDPAITAFDADPEETVDRLLYQGLLNAQSWMITWTPYRGWKSTVQLTLGDAETDGTRFAAFPSNLLRMAGDERTSPLLYSDGRRWGQMVDDRDPSIWGSYFWLDNGTDSDGLYVDGIRFAKGASIPTTGIYLQYHYRHAELDDDTNIEFPLEDRILIPAEAAVIAVHEAWAPLVEESDQQMVLRNLMQHRKHAAERARRSRQGQKFRSRRSTYGTRSFH